MNYSHSKYAVNDVISQFSIIFFCITLMFFFAYSGAVDAASFDCQKATTKIEFEICDNYTLDALDEQLGANYNILKNSTNKSDFSKIKKQQAQWLKRRNQCLDSFCLVYFYLNRINELCGLIRTLSNSCKLDYELVSTKTLIEFQNTRQYYLHDVTDEFNEWEIWNGRCRGDSPVTDYTIPACNARENLYERLTAKGYCYGTNYDGPPYGWHICKNR